MRRTVRQLADAIASVRRQAVHAPGFGEFLAVSRISHILIARIGIRQRTHIARALNVVLATYRVNAHAGLTEVAGQHREAGQ
ncbi:hypothetical protein SDC9_199340 [bioreactor metagenome]|uniref:Uncharacterized protein n=1 Tax=bioreactor metagenome TaxID=1076179 RepID=A0A645IK81_9ZZZZ